jgi:hypothetical protein
MTWKDLTSKDRWLIFTAALQAAATVGTFLVALVGFWKVTPIITYQVQQQESRALQAAAAPAGDTVTDRFAADAVSWWSAQVASYQRILDLTGSGAPRGLKVSFEVIADGTTAIASALTPDLLVVTAVAPDGKVETVRVPVNDDAMPPSQYLQCRLNQGVFAGLDATKRTRVETAVQRYVNRHMVPRVPSAHVRDTMSLAQLHDEIALHQSRRVEALQHLLGLKDMLDSALRD